MSLSLQRYKFRHRHDGIHAPHAYTHTDTYIKGYSAIFNNKSQHFVRIDTEFIKARANISYWLMSVIMFVINASSNMTKSVQDSRFSTWISQQIE